MQKKNRRNSSKYPALDKKLNLKARFDYIEADYLDGVVNEKGELVIRAATEAEKKWLNQYYEESVIGNFLWHPELRKLNKQKTSLIKCKYVRQMEVQVKQLTSEGAPKQIITNIKKTMKITKQQNAEVNSRKIKEIEDKMQEIREQVMLYPDKEDHKQVYAENNARNRCIYTKSKITGNLVNLGHKPELEDVYMSYSVLSNYEDILINEIDGKYEDEGEIISNLGLDNYLKEE